MKKWTRWRVVTSKGRLYIKRNGLGDNTGRSQNFPAKKYKHIQDNPEEMDSLVVRLNQAEDQRRQEKFMVENAHIPQRWVDDFIEYLSGEHGRERTTREVVSPFIKYGLKYMQGAYGPNPIDWTESEKKWGNYLMKKGFSKSYILSIIQTVNRFFKYTHERNRKDLPMIILNPISSHKLNMYEEGRKQKLNLEGKRDPFGYFISKEDKELIFKNLPEDIYATVRLIDLYGLRESEALALPLKQGILSKNRLQVNLQIISVGRGLSNIETDLPKWRIKRKAFHWHNTPLKEVKELIESVKIMHPDTLYTKFADAVAGLKTSKTYRLHDFRRTFITQAFDDGRIPTDIMDCVGHKNLSTTLKYRRPKDEEDDEVIW